MSIDNVKIEADDTVLQQTEYQRSHHHHTHHKHHRRNRRALKRKDNKVIAFFKQNRSVLVNIVSCAVSVVLIVAMAIGIDLKKLYNHPDAQTDVVQSTVKIETSFYAQKVSLTSTAITQYIHTKDNDAKSVFETFGGYYARLNEGLPLRFTYRFSGLPAGVKVQSAVLEISEQMTYLDALTYALDLNETQVDIYNLKTGTTYYYRVILTLDNNREIIAAGDFETENAPRILKIDGVQNARDIGGLKTADGKTIKQGLLFRGTELDGAVETKYAITDAGLQQMIGVLGVRFDMDLRGQAENKKGVDALGKNVIHRYYGIEAYTEIFSGENPARLREIFADLADPDNYPIYMHCTYGRDRTGSVCYLLEGLLGVSDDDLDKAYHLSVFTDGYANTAEFDAFVEKVNTLKGDTTKEKVEGYLLSIGVTPAEIASIREVFLGES